MAESSFLGYASQLPGLEDRDPYSHPSKFVQKLPGSTSLTVVNERRPSGMLVVNKLREAVDAWRDSGYEGALGDDARRLFRWWFEEAEAEGFRPYWGQREAIETLAYLVEVEAAATSRSSSTSTRTFPTRTCIEHGIEFQTTHGSASGRSFGEADGGVDTIDLPAEDLARFALKMATGTGKTLVMALSIALVVLPRAPRAGLAAVDELPRFSRRT